MFKRTKTKKPKLGNHDYIFVDDLKEQFQKKGFTINKSGDIQKLLKNYGCSLQINSESIIPTSVAQKAFESITGEKLNLNKIKYPNFLKDIPLDFVSQETASDDMYITTDDNSKLYEAEEKNEVKYSDLVREIKIGYTKLIGENNSNQPLILGVACFGGFLRGESMKEYDPFLLSIQPGMNIFVGDRGSGKSTALNLLSLLYNCSQKYDQEGNILDWIAPEKRLFRSYGNAQVAAFLKAFGIEKYICYFQDRNNSNFTNAFYADINTKKWSLLYKNGEEWLLSSKDPTEVFPKILTLRQGDVFRITDSNNQLIINQILEKLDQNIKHKKSKLIASFNSFATQYNLCTEPQKTLLFKDNLFVKIKSDNQMVDRFIKDAKSDLLFLRKSINNNYDVSVAYKNIEDYVDNKYAIASHLDGRSYLKLVNRKETGLWYLYIGIVKKFIKERIKEYIALHTDDTYDIKKHISYINAICNFLEERLDIIYQLQQILDSSYEWNNEISNVCLRVKNLIENRNAFFREQINYCDKIKSSLNFLENQKIKFVSSFPEEEAFADDLGKNKGRYDLLLNADLQSLEKSFQNNDLKSRLEEINDYNHSIAKLINWLEKSRSSSRFINFPIDVQLKQGNIYRSFRKLSYGQKSSILLTIISIMTKAEIILIDQPEDNLDSDATAKILTPTLLKICREKSLAIATHNSSLVMGLGNSKPNLVVLKSPNEYGGKQNSGKLNDPEIIGHMFEILEGGLGAWEEKLRFFKSFTDDLSFIEDTHFESTIANLRNAIQPRMSLNGRLNTLRHDLNNKFPTLEEAKEYSIEELSSIISTLENHDAEIIKIIENIKNLSMGSYPENIKIYLLLSKMIDTNPKAANIEYILDHRLKDCFIYADPNDVELIFRNLFNNSAKAIREARQERKKAGIEKEYKGEIKLFLNYSDSQHIEIKMQDNGIGISPEIIKSLYRERCSTRIGISEEHGQGGITIKNYLRENGGKIRIDYENTKYKCVDSKTVQYLTFKKHQI